MRQQLHLFVHEDTVGHLTEVKKKLERRNQRQVSMSEVVDWMVRKHWVRTMKARSLASKPKSS